jgi:GGDEF domain-containing protein
LIRVIPAKTEAKWEGRSPEMLAAADRQPREPEREPVTISIGVTGTEGGETLAAWQFLSRADANLYQAKQQGRNRGLPFLSAGLEACPTSVRAAQAAVAPAGR